MYSEINYRIEDKIVVVLLWFTTTTEKVKATAETATATVAASENSTRDQKALTPARSETIIGAKIVFS